jgi:hypothetical protein
MRRRAPNPRAEHLRQAYRGEAHEQVQDPDEPVQIAGHETVLIQAQPHYY